MKANRTERGRCRKEETNARDDRRVWNCSYYVAYGDLGSWYVPSGIFYHVRRETMHEVMSEYGGMILSTVGTIVLLGVLGYECFAADGLLAQLVSIWGNGGC